MIQIRDCILQSHHLGYRKINLEQIKGIYIVLELTVQKNRLVIVLQLQPWESTFFRVDVTLAYSPSLFLNTIIFKDMETFVKESGWDSCGLQIISSSEDHVFYFICVPHISRILLYVTRYLLNYFDFHSLRLIKRNPFAFMGTNSSAVLPKIRYTD